jgi:hypothetical protein
MLDTMLFEPDDMDQEFRDHGAGKKGFSKYNAYMTRQARKVEITEGDAVLLKQRLENKLSPTFQSEPYEVVSKKGNNITIQKDGVCYKRNVTHVKKYEEYDTRDKELCENVNSKDDVTGDRDDDRATDIVKSRPTRATKLPSRFDDLGMS